MVFSSAAFLFFFLPLVLALYFPLIRLPRLRNLLLLVASLFFYFYGEAEYIIVMLISVVANYYFGIWIDNERERGSTSNLPITCSVIVNIGLLIIFKYTNFFVDNLNPLIVAMGFTAIDIPRIHLPIGISFFTFHSVSYIMDISRRTSRANRSIADLALYIALFPQLVAGPIVRYKDIAHQLTSRFITLERFSLGLNRFVAGLAKKVLIANVVALPADKIFSIPPDQLTTPVAWLGVVCYTIQIYFDFSGYSDMAIGLADMFGFKFLENFNYPYISRSIQEFWRRWHISLSTWFRDYVYIPMGGSRVPPWRVTMNLVTIFFLTGMWHGASWNFIIWGLFHGFFLGMERGPFGRLVHGLKGPWSVLPWAYTMLVAMVGWVFFRADTLGTAMAFVSAMFGMGHGSGQEWNVALFMTPKLKLVLVAAAIGAAPWLPWFKTWRREHLATLRLGRFASVDDILEGVSCLVLMPTLLVLSVMSLASGTHNPFIYFQF